MRIVRSRTKADSRRRLVLHDLAEHFSAMFPCAPGACVLIGEDQDAGAVDSLALNQIVRKRQHGSVAGPFYGYFNSRFELPVVVLDAGFEIPEVIADFPDAADGVLVGVSGGIVADGEKTRHGDV